jgi:hypothetical protein
MSSSSIAAQSSQEFLNKFDAAMAWMRSMGVNVDQGRLASYRDAANNWAALQHADAPQETGDDLFADVTSAVFEVPQFLEIHAAFRDENIGRLGGIVAKLKKAIEGPVHLQNETVASNSGRNFLFEAVAASRVHRPEKGSSVIFNAPTDTGFTLSKSTIWIECKRISSANQVASNVTKACAQLQRTLDKHPKTNQRGLVALDISKLITLPPPKYIFKTSREAEIGPRTEAMIDDYINKQSAVWENIFVRADPRIIGVVLRLTAIATSKDIGKYIFVHQWGINPRRGIDINDERLLMEAVQCFERT